MRFIGGRDIIIRQFIGYFLAFVVLVFRVRTRDTNAGTTRINHGFSVALHFYWDGLSSIKGSAGTHLYFDSVAEHASTLKL
jgi:hypothetical protein